MMPECDPGVFTRGFYWCEEKEVAEVVLLTPIDGTFEALKGCSEGVRKFSGFFHTFTEEERDRRRICTDLLMDALTRLVSRI